MKFSQKICSGILVAMIGLHSIQAHCVPGVGIPESGLSSHFLRFFTILMVGTDLLSLRWTAMQMGDLQLDLASNANTVPKTNTTISTVQKLNQAAMFAQSVGALGGLMGLKLGSERDWKALVVAASATATAFSLLLAEYGMLATSALPTDVMNTATTNGKYTLVANGVFGAPLLSGLFVAAGAGMKHCLGLARSPEHTPLLPTHP